MATYRQMAPDLDKQLRKEWYEALAKENCVEVNNLLKRDRRLLNEGWEADPQASVLLKLPLVWKGRTALHVAARRGDVNLTKLILNPHSTNVAEDQDQGAIGPIDSHLLEAVDGDYELDALAMAVVNGNRDIVDLLKKASRDCTSNPYGIINDAEDGRQKDEQNKEKRGKEEAVIRIMKKVLKAIERESSSMIRMIRDEYKEDCDFNFLDINLYLFHFTFSTGKSNKSLVDIRRNVLKLARERGMERERELLLVELRDGQGRTALHVAVDNKKVREFLDVVKDFNLDDSYLNAVDSAGRTPLYRAAAKGLISAVEDLLKDPETNFMAEIKCHADQWGRGVDIDKLSWRNGFKSDCVYVPREKLERKAFNHETSAHGGLGPPITSLEEITSTALHMAIIHKHSKIVKNLMDKRARNVDDKCLFDVDCRRRFTWPVVAALQGDGNPSLNRSIRRDASPLQLAVLVGNIPILQNLLEVKDGKQSKPSPMEDLLSSFLVAAARGTPGTIKLFLDSANGKFNPLTIDSFENNALHYALKGKYVEVHPHLVDFVGCDHVFNWRWDSADWVSDWLANPEETSPIRKNLKNTIKMNFQEKYVLRMGSISDSDLQEKFGQKNLFLQAEQLELHEKYGQRMGSINLLLEAGVNIWDRNKQGRTANPEPNASDEFAKWWYGKVAQETQQVQEKFNAAANAITVTATLVATASYVGPLQPPLSYASGVQVNIVAVRVFVVCDSLSFYLALAAIMLALLPSVQLPQKSLFRELVRTRILVALALTFLFPSIICVLLAFTAAYIAVIPDHGLAHHGLIVGPTVVGGFVCLVVMMWFGARLVKVLHIFWKDMKKEISGSYRKSRFVRVLSSSTNCARDHDQSSPRSPCR